MKAANAAGRRILPLLAWAFALAALPHAAQGLTIAPPSSYTKPSPDGRYLFVMIPPATVEEEASRLNAQAAAEIRGIRRVYSQSGLYRNDGTATPLWTVDWYSYDVSIASDGVHLVRRGPWGSDLTDEAFSFFANGRPVRTYAISELVDVEFLLPRMGSGFKWCKGYSLNEGKLQYAVNTEDGNSFVFDMTTGNIVAAQRHARIKLWAVLGAVVAIIAVLVFISVPCIQKYGGRRERTG